VAWVKEKGTPLHAQVFYSLTPPLIAVQPPLTHAQACWLSGIVLESPQLEGSVEKVSLNHAAIWAEWGGPGYGGGIASHAQGPLSSIPTLIAVQLPLTHAQISLLIRTVLESPQVEGSVVKVSLNHAAI